MSSINNKKTKKIQKNQKKLNFTTNSNIVINGASLYNSDTIKL